MNHLDSQEFQNVSDWFDRHQGELLEDLTALVRIPSIAEEKPQETPEAQCGEESQEKQRAVQGGQTPQKSPNTPEEEEEPFGRPCREALDAALALGRKYGFDTENCGNRVGKIGSRLQDLSNTIGFWNHLDVVPVGSGWTGDPFVPRLAEGFLIGRGAQDNKGPAVGNLYLMRCIRDLGIPMKHDLCLFVGCDEEKSMKDLEYYTARFETPMLSMVVDSGFPVCYGEKGILSGAFLTDAPFDADVVRVWGGTAENMIPDRAFCALRYTKSLADWLEENGSAEHAGGAEPAAGETRYEIQDDTILVTGYGTAKHSAFPEGSINAIHVLADFLSSAEILSETDRAVFAFLSRTTEAYYGEPEGIGYSDDVSGRTTAAGTILSTTEDGKACLTLNIRHAITHDVRALEEGLQQYAKEHQARWETAHSSAPHYFPREHPAVDFLTDLYNDWSGEHTEPFVMGGGTYARKLPNAFAYGIGGMRKTPEDLAAEQKLFRPGTGGAHEPDEGLNLRMYFAAMKFLTTAVIQLDQIL